MGKTAKRLESVYGHLVSYQQSQDYVSGEKQICFHHFHTACEENQINFMTLINSILNHLLFSLTLCKAKIIQHDLPHETDRLHLRCH